MHIKALEQVLGQQMETDGKGTCVVTLDGIPLLLRFVEAEELFLLHIEIGYAQTAGGIVHTRLPGANFLLSETGGAALSLTRKAEWLPWKCLFLWQESCRNFSWNR